MASACPWGKEDQMTTHARRHLAVLLSIAGSLLPVVLACAGAKRWL
jgi:hypothetical protein